MVAPQAPTFSSADVATLYAAFDPAVQSVFGVLRQVILDAAAQTAGVGPLLETVKWGQPSYLTAETGSGSTIRIAPAPAGSGHDCAMFFICHTHLVEGFKATFGGTFSYDGDRALLFSAGDDIPYAELRECVTIALTYHQAKGTDRGTARGHTGA